MTCPELEALERYATGVATGADRLQIDQHLPACPACAAQLAEIRRNLKLAARLAAPPAPPKGPRVEVRQAPLVSERAPPSSERTSHPPAGAIAIAVVGALIVVAIGAALVTRRERAASTAATAAELAAARAALDLAQRAFDRGDLATARSLARDALANLRPLSATRDLSRARGLRLLAAVALDDRDAAEAGSLSDAAVAACADAPDGPDRSAEQIRCLTTRAYALRDQGRLIEAEAAARKALAVAREVNTRVASGAAQSGIANGAASSAGAAGTAQSAVATRAAVSGAGVADTAAARGSPLKHGGADAGGGESSGDPLFGDAQASVATQMHTLGAILQLRGRFDEAAELHHAALALRESLFGAADVRCAASHWHLAHWHLAQQQLSAAAERFRTQLALYDAASSPQWFAAVARIELVGVLRELGRFADGRPLVEEGCRRLLANPGVAAGRRAWAVTQAAAFFEAWHAAAPEEGHGRTAASWRERLPQP